MPGVHQHFMAMEGHVKTLDHGMISCFDKLETMVQAGFRGGCSALQDYNQECGVQLADQRLILPGYTPHLNKLPPRRQAQQSSHTGDDHVASSSPGARHHKMVIKHHFIQLLWNKWDGLGEYEK
jgi:hypothetical protein